MSACVLWPSRRSRATIWAWLTPAGICLLMTPEKIRLVALPSSHGPSTDSVTLTAASTRPAATSSRCGASVPSSRRLEPRKLSDFSVDIPPMNAAGPRPGPMPPVFRYIGAQQYSRVSESGGGAAAGPGLHVDLIVAVPAWPDGGKSGFEELAAQPGEHVGG